jgi:N-acetylglucosamine-6-sulfatase
MKKTTLKTAILTVLLLAPLAVINAAEPAKPNIVFIFSDDHAVQAIGAYGERLSDFCKKQGVTPNIDKLAEQGGLFVNSFCGNSLCSPSRASVLTGLLSHANGVMHLHKPITPGLWTFPMGLKEIGYQTAVFGKWHLASKPDYQDWCITWDQGAYDNPEMERSTGKEKFSGYATDIVTDLSLDWLKKRDSSKPFFLAVHHKAPHRNWIPPTRYATWLDDVEIPEPANLFDDYANRASPASNQKMEIDRDMQLAGDLKVGGRLANDPRFVARNADYQKNKPTGKDLVHWKYQIYLKDYLRCVKAVDDSVGQIVSALKSEGILENTIIIYSSDQGFYLGEHGWFDKRWIYEQSLHMPFIIRWPGVVKPGTRFTEFIQNIDYAPTFMAMAGGQAPTSVHGRSIVPVLKAETPADWRQSVYYHWFSIGGHMVPVHYGVRTSRYTLAYYPATDEWELFDLEKDPQQMRSVYADPAYATTVTELKTELTRLRTQYGDTADAIPEKGKTAKNKEASKKSTQ